MIRINEPFFCIAGSIAFVIPFPLFLVGLWTGFIKQDPPPYGMDFFLCMLMMTFCTAFLTAYFWPAFYSYTKISKRKIVCSYPFKLNPIKLDWNDIAEVGIGSYTYMITYNYIYFSKKPLTQEQMSNINKVENSYDFVKMKYSKRLYEYVAPICEEHGIDFVEI